MPTVEQKVAHWEELMQSFPTDGWDGATAAIAAHDQRVIKVEEELDELDPDWHDRLDTEFSRRSTPKAARESRAAKPRIPGQAHV